MLREFREFAVRGNVVDLAVAVIIGAAFGGIVTSLVNDVIMPPIGVLLGQVDFSEYYINLTSGEYPSLKAARDAGAAVIAYGAFINVLVNFLIVAWVVFLLVRAINRMRRSAEAPEKPAPTPSTKNCPYCLSTIPLAATRCPHCTSEQPAQA